DGKKKRILNKNLIYIKCFWINEREDKAMMFFARMFVLMISFLITGDVFSTVTQQMPRVAYVDINAFFTQEDMNFEELRKEIFAPVEALKNRLEKETQHYNETKALLSQDARVKMEANLMSMREEIPAKEQTSARKFEREVQYQLSQIIIKRAEKFANVNGYDVVIDIMQNRIVYINPSFNKTGDAVAFMDATYQNNASTSVIEKSDSKTTTAVAKNDTVPSSQKNRA
ncbi:MAG: OmpH family outer membrane protein, partial [Candidatus Babeliales bacterium]